MKNAQEFKLVTATPVHVGSGVKYSPVEYLVDRDIGILKRFSIPGIVRVAKERSKLSFVASIFKRKDIHNQSLNKIIETNNGFRDLILSVEPDYTASIKGENIPEKCHIEEFLKLGNKTFIPGSELKGSLRRALFIYVLKKDKDLLNQLIKDLKKIALTSEIEEDKRKIRREIEKISQNFENKIFRAGNSNAQNDILKLVQISDSSLKRATPETLKVKEISVYYTDGEKKENASIFSETITPKTEFTFKMGIFLPNKLKDIILHNQYHELVKNAVLSEDPKELISLWKKGENLSIEEDRDTLILLKDKSIYADKFLKWLNEKREKLNIIRLGKHEGFLFTTVMAVVKQEDEELFSEVFKLVAPKFSGTPNKTRKLTAKEKLPLGFCVIKEISKDVS